MLFDEWLIELGEKLGFLLVYLLISKMLFFVILLNCLDSVLIFVCVVDYRDFFILFMLLNDKKRVNVVKVEFVFLYGGYSD